MKIKSIYIFLKLNFLVYTVYKNIGIKNVITAMNICKLQVSFMTECVKYKLIRGNQALTLIFFKFSGKVKHREDKLL